MSGDARQAVEDFEAKNRFDSDHKQTSLHHRNPDAEIYSENDDVPMSQQPTELRNGNEPRRCRIPPYAAGPTESTSNGREPPSRWITETEWTHYIQEDPHCPRLRNRQWSDVSIFRVPRSVKNTQREAYVPGRVSLGPYHHGSAEVTEMGHDKGRALRRMSVDLNYMDFANRAMKEILKLEKEIRDSYEENIDCNGETLARMLCLDGCFILEALTSFAVGGDMADECYDPIFGKMKFEYVGKDILCDIVMLENQVPLIVLRKLLQLQHERINLDAVAKHMARFLLPFQDENLDIKQGCCHHRHLLDFMHAAIASPALDEDKRVDEGGCSISIGCCSRQCITMLQCKSKERNAIAAPPLNEDNHVDEDGCRIRIGCCSRQCSRQCITRLKCKSKERNDTEKIPHAVELRNAGIKFSALQEGCINQIMFDENSATIFLPPISIMDGTERVFRNLIAYEICKPFETNYLICYVSLMDDLIDSEQDVALLKRMGVLENWLGSDKEVAELFNGLCREVTGNMKDVFDNLTEKVNAHYNNEMKVQIGKLVHDHFSSPWNALALTGAIVILLLTVLQTIFTIISTYKK